MVNALRQMYAAASAEAAVAQLDAFERGRWGANYSTIAASWLRRWPEIIPFFAFSPSVR